MVEAHDGKTVSIVVNTLDRDQYLKKLLESLRYLDYDNFEVVVVNGPSTDGTEELLSEWGDIIKVGNCPEANLSMSRNIGIAMAAGEYVAFLDDDAVPEPEWLNQAVDAFSSEDVAGVGGRVFDNTGYSYQCEYVSATRLGNGIWHLNHPSPYYCFPFAFEFPYLTGCNSIFRRSVLLEIGGFDEEYQYYLDETDVCLRLIDSGYIIKQLSNSYVHHKFAASHIRENKIPKYHYPILKSKIYFSNRHGRKYCTQDEIDRDNNIFIESNRNQITDCIAENIVTEQDLQLFEMHVSDAQTHGKHAAELPQKLISQNLLQSHMSAYRHFQTIKCDETSLTIVFLCGESFMNAEHEVGGVARNKAKDLAASGHKVHVIALGSGHNTVDFEHGIWIHRILPYECVKSNKAVELGIPHEIWNKSRAFLDEIDRISTHRSVDIVQAPIANIIGSAVLLSERYCVIVSLSSSDMDSVNTAVSSGGNEMQDVCESLEFIKLYCIKNSHGILTDSIDTVNVVSSFCEIENTDCKFISSAQGVSDLTQGYRKILNEIYVNQG